MRQALAVIAGRPCGDVDMQQRGQSTHFGMPRRHLVDPAPPAPLPRLRANNA
jgi:hypothetical protein